MSMSFGGGDQYAPLMEAIMRRRQMQEMRQPQQQQQMMHPLGGTMQMQPVQFGQGYGGTSGAASMAGAMPSASSMADMLKRMREGWGSGGANKSFHFANTASGPSSGMDV